jgi:DNA-binding response OmpR family regulator
VSAAGPPRVLVLEDEWLIADHLGWMLTDLGYEVVGPVSTAHDALAVIEAGPPDAAVLDVSLASGKSFAVAEALARRSVPFIFLTGYASADLPPALRETPILGKPVSPLDLKVRLEAIVAAVR